VFSCFDQNFVDVMIGRMDGSSVEKTLLVVNGILVVFSLAQLLAASYDEFM